MIAVAYFHYDTGRSDIEVFADEQAARDWLFERWGWIIEDENSNPRTLNALIYAIGEYYVKVEILEFDPTGF